MNKKNLQLLIERYVRKQISLNNRKSKRFSRINENIDENIDKRNFIKNVMNIFKLVCDTDILSYGESFIFAPVLDYDYDGDFENINTADFEELSDDREGKLAAAENLYDYYTENGPGNLEFILIFNNDNLGSTFEQLSEEFPYIDYEVTNDKSFKRYKSSAEYSMSFKDTEFDIAIQVLKTLLKAIRRIKTME